ncbi:long-chain fatty acid-CoA ligase [Coemansia sp. RSA 2336]|nr:long-chain fatty acid-CoA ligase [Coemansia sp. RSA 2336]
MPGTGSSTETEVHRYPTAMKGLTTSAPPDIETVYDAFQYRFKLEPNKQTMGRRQVLQVIDETGWKRVALGDYEWMTYREIDQVTRNLGAGLATLGVERVAIYAPTSREWTLAMLGCYSQGMQVVTAYDTLGEHGLAHAVRQAGAGAVVAKADQLPVVERIWEQNSFAVVYYADAWGMPKAAEAALERLRGRGAQVMTLDEVGELGKRHPRDLHVAGGDDTALVMYTSGTTGEPKGALIGHRGLLAICGAIHQLVPDFIDYEHDRVLSYLPLSHVLAFFVETYCLYSGLAIGYGTPRTLADDGVVGGKGDLRALQPAVILGVPQVWHTIRAGILRQVAQRPQIVQKLFHGAVRLKTWLVQWGLPTWVLDAVVFRRTRAGTGGRLKIAITGGAPVSAHVQQFMAAAVCPMIQGYGLTEASGLVAVQLPGDTSTCNVGVPVPSVELKLVDAPNEGYYACNGQGEVCVRGPSVFGGYLGRADQTQEVMGDDGWLFTGDIGEWTAEGRLRIVDRRRNLVKLAHGEYVALEALESAYASAPLVANVCVIADAHMTRPCALVSVDRASVAQWAQQQQQQQQQQQWLKERDMDVLAQSVEFRAAVEQELAQAAQSCGLARQERLAAVRVVREAWTPENGMLTAANKLRRREIKRASQALVAEMLAEASLPYT